MYFEDPMYDAWHEALKVQYDFKQRMKHLKTVLPDDVTASERANLDDLVDNVMHMVQRELTSIELGREERQQQTQSDEQHVQK
jgi:hypothetical protein